MYTKYVYIQAQFKRCSMKLREMGKSRGFSTVMNIISKAEFGRVRNNYYLRVEMKACIYMCIYMYMYVHVYTCTCTCICTGMCPTIILCTWRPITWGRVYMSVSSLVHYSCIYILLHVHVHVYTCVYTCTCTVTI